jgi:hypothetical protein
MKLMPKVLFFREIMNNFRHYLGVNLIMNYFFVEVEKRRNGKPASGFLPGDSTTMGFIRISPCPGWEESCKSTKKEAVSF